MFIVFTFIENLLNGALNVKHHFGLQDLFYETGISNCGSGKTNNIDSNRVNGFIFMNVHFAQTGQNPSLWAPEKRVI